jgi:hypothetical protein
MPVYYGPEGQLATSLLKSEVVALALAIMIAGCHGHETKLVATKSPVAAPKAMRLPPKTPCEALASKIADRWQRFGCALPVAQGGVMLLFAAAQLGDDWKKRLDQLGVSGGVRIVCSTSTILWVPGIRGRAARRLGKVIVGKDNRSSLPELIVFSPAEGASWSKTNGKNCQPSR